MNRKAISLVELVLVVAILGLLAAIMFPIIFAAKNRAKTTPCVSNMRQFYGAWAIYRGENSDAIPDLVSEFVGKPQYGILRCPSDNFRGSKQLRLKTAGNTIVVLLPVLLPRFRELLFEADANYGIAFCVLHGEWVMTDAEPRVGTTGKVVRLRQDGSVQMANAGHLCYDAGGGTGTYSRPDWLMFTDAPCPPEFGMGKPCR